MSKMTQKEWEKQLIYYNKSVSWVDPKGKKHSLWSKVPNIDYEKGIINHVDNAKMSSIYYDWINENKPELLEK